VTAAESQARIIAAARDAEARRVGLAGADSDAREWDRHNPPDCLCGAGQLQHHPGSPYVPPGYDPPTPAEEPLPPHYYCTGCGTRWNIRLA